MSYGFEILSGFNSTLIDENRTAVRRIATHTISTGTPNEWNVSKGTATFSGAVGRYIVVCGDSRFHHLEIKSKSVGGYEITATVHSTVATTLNVTVIADVTPPAPVNGDYGVEVYGPSGNRLFSTTTTNIALLGDVWLAASSAGGDTSSVTVSNPTGRPLLIAPHVGFMGFVIAPLDANTSRVWTGFARVVSPTVIEYRYQPIVTIGGFQSTESRFSNYMPLFLG